MLPAARFLAKLSDNQVVFYSDDPLDAAGNVAGLIDAHC
jgi:hypothetical protein